LAVALDLTHRPNVLYLASIERMHAARQMLDLQPPDYVLAAYTAGLAVEAILQALALEGGATHDARHTLSNWLNKCPRSLQDSLKGSADWNVLLALWDNGLRYLSFDGLLGYLRAKGYAKGKKGGVQSIVRTVVRHLVDAAEVVHKRAVAQWLTCTKR
jgi:hypothetical protein